MDIEKEKEKEKEEKKEPNMPRKSRPLLQNNSPTQ